MSKATEAKALQRKIFSRWVNQKIQGRGKKINDVVDDLKDGDMLIILMEVLSEKEFPNWKKIQGGSRMKQMDSCNQALKFVDDCGVEMKIKPSAENLVDAAELLIMGLIWAIMLKFMKLDEDEDDGQAATTFSDALKMWIANQVASYELPVANMTKSFHDGKVFCALVHKFRPKLLDYEEAREGPPEANLVLAFKAAEKYFGLEQYLQPSDIAKLDDKSMVVYASEYYYGIAQQRKVDLAAKRVAKLAAFTKENDRLKADFTTRAKELRHRFDKVLVGLSDTEIEDTMAGAVRRLGLFNDYRKQDKGVLFRESFALDSMAQSLDRRLSSHKRPAYVPESGCSVPELMTSLHEVETKEASQNAALHQELNRQIKLAKIFEQYQGRFNTLDSWVAVQREYLEKKQEILSVGAAKFALNQLEAYFTQYVAVSATIPAMKAWAKELLDNKFEHSSVVEANEGSIATGLKDLEQKSAHKKKVHEDDLARETLKAQVRGWNDDHVADHGRLHLFITAATASLGKKEDVASIKDAELHLGLTRAIHQERQDRSSNIAPLKSVGADILSTKYESDLSKWEYEKPEEVQAREKELEDAFAAADASGAEKVLVLEDDLAREQFKEQVRQWNENHKLQNTNLQAWIAKSRSYVDTKEPCGSVENAQDNLVVHRAYMSSEIAMRDNDVAALQKQGKEIVDAKYETKYSSYVFDSPAEVSERESSVLEAFVYLNSTSASKLAVLEDDLAREEFRFKVNKWNEQHVRQHMSLQQWIGVSKAYVDKKEDVDSVETAHDNLVVVRAYLQSQSLKQDGDVAGLQALGKQILEAKYETPLSSWVFATPDEVQTREGFVTDSFAYLVDTSNKKLAVLEDDLARELFKFKLALWNDQNVTQHTRLQAWVEAQTTYLAVVEEFDSILDCEKNLKTLAAYEADKADVTKINVSAFNKLGNEILAAKYETSLSSWVWEDMPAVQARLDYVANSWQSLDGSSAAKKTKLDADLAKEIRKEELRVEWAKLSGEFAGVSRDNVASCPNTMFGFVLEEVEAFAATLSEMDADINAKAADLKNKYDPVWAEMLELAVRTEENPYSALTPDDMSKGQDDLAAAMAARQARFNEELEKQRADDKACRDLAGAVDPFVSAISANKGQVADCKQELDGQLVLLNSVAGEPKAEVLASVQECQKVVDDRAIIYNRHTLNNGSDAEVQFGQYVEYMNTKRAMIEAEIEYKQLRGLTKEQYVEMKQQFDQFDKDGSGFLDKREFRSCLYSMGEERGKKEIEAILEKLGNGDSANVKISYDGYKEFMIEQLGDTDTEEEILKGFKLMNRQEETCQWEIMADVLDNDVLDYIKSTHQEDYTAWTQSVFAR